MYCDHCGASIDSTSQFCAQCGSRVEKETTARREQAPASFHAKRRSSPKLLLTVLILAIPLALVGFIFFRVLSTDEISEVRKILAQAAQSVEAMEDTHWKAFTLNDIARVQARTGDRTAAAKSIDRAKQAVSGMQNELKVIPLDTIAATQARIGDRAAAEIFMREVLQTSRSAGSDDLRNATEKTLAIIQAATGDVSGALARIEALSDLRGKDFALSNITSEQADWGEVTAALQTASRIRDSDLRVRALTRVAIAQAKMGDRNGANATFREALHTTEGLKDGPQKAAFLITIASAQGDAADRTAAALTIQQAMQVELAVASDYEKRDLAIAYAKSGQLKQAYATMNTIVKDYEKDIVLESAAMAEAQFANVRAALKTAATIKNHTWNGKALRGIAAAQAKAGDVKGAIEWASRQTSPLSKASGLLGVAEGILERKQAGKTKSSTVKQ